MAVWRPRDRSVTESRLLDEIADRTLGNAARHHATPLRSPAEVVDALTSGAATGQVNGLLGGFDDTGTDSDRPPAVLDSSTIPLVSTAAVPSARLRDEPTSRGAGRLGRIVGVLAGALLLVGATLVGLDLLLGAVDGGGDDDGTQAVPTTTATPNRPPPSPPRSPLRWQSPQRSTSATARGSGDENPEDTELAIDGDPETTWVTQGYFDPLEDQKPGVGRSLDLGAALQVVGLNLTLVGDDSGLEIRVPADGGTPGAGEPRRLDRGGRVRFGRLPSCRSSSIRP